MEAYRTLLSCMPGEQGLEGARGGCESICRFRTPAIRGETRSCIVGTISLSSQNEAHGKLMLVQRLLKSVGDAEAATATLSGDMATLAEAVTSNASKLLELNRCAITQASYLEVVQDLIGVRRSAFASVAVTWSA